MLICELIERTEASICSAFTKPVWLLLAVITAYVGNV
jgi:hypothetical protein